MGAFNLAVIGTGRWGINHVRTAHKLFGSHLKYVCDSNPMQSSEIQKVSPDIRFVTNVEQVLEDRDVNSVIIATPAHTHYALGKMFLEAGKNVLVEKPLALFVEQARELDQLATKQKKILMVGHLLMYHPAIHKIKKMITQGDLGRLQYIYSNRLNLGTIRKEENILWSFAPHDISVLQYLIESEPIDVKASGGIFLQPGIHDTTLTNLEYEKNIFAHIHVSWLHPFKEHRLVIIGDKSMLVFEDTRPTDKLIYYPKGIDWVNGEPRKRDSGYQVIEFEDKEPLVSELLHFEKCVRNQETPLSDGKNAIQVLETIRRAELSLTQRNSGSQGQGARRSPESSIAPIDFYVHPTAIVDKGCAIGKGTKIWHFSHVQTGSKIGADCVLGQNVNVGNNVVIGSHVKIQNNVSVYEGVQLDDYAFCGPSVVFTNIRMPRCEFPQRGSEFYVSTRVGYGASLGANSTIVCGHQIGQFAFVGAGAVVTRDVPDYAMVVGNPARVVGWVCRCGTKLNFKKEQKTECIKCYKVYRKLQDQLQIQEETKDEVFCN